MKIPEKCSDVTEAFADEWFVGLPIRPLRNIEAKNTREHLARSASRKKVRYLLAHDRPSRRSFR